MLRWSVGGINLQVLPAPLLLGKALEQFILWLQSLFDYYIKHLFSPDIQISHDQVDNNENYDLSEKSRKPTLL